WWISCAVRNSSWPSSTDATAARCRVERAPIVTVAPPGSLSSGENILTGHSMLVPVIPVRRVQVPVVHVVDVVAVPDRRMAALLPVSVVVAAGRLVGVVGYDHLRVVLVR